MTTLTCRSVASISSQVSHSILAFRMLDRIIHFSVTNKLITGLLLLAMVGWGVYSAANLPIDALPDVTNNQVQVITYTGGRKVHHLPVGTPVQEPARARGTPQHQPQWAFRDHHCVQ
jgi:hypothetical protein